MESEGATPSQRIELDARTLPRVWSLPVHPVLPSNPITLAIWFYLLCRHRLVVALISKQRPGDTGRLVGHGDEDDIGWSSLQQLFGPSRLGIWFGTTPAQYGAGTVDEQAPDIAVTALGYASQPVLAATRMLPGHKAETGRELSP